MTKNFEWTTANGQQAKLTAIYKVEMKEESSYLDDYKLSPKLKPRRTANLTLFLDGKEIDNCSDPCFWELAELDYSGTTVKKIRGLKAAFKSGSPEIKRYEEFLAEVLANGKSEEVKEYEAEENRKAIAKKLKNAISLYEAAQKQGEIPDEKTARKMEIRYNNLYNEGGDGYVPHVYYQEEVEEAAEFIRENSDYFNKTEEQKMNEKRKMEALQELLDRASRYSGEYPYSQGRMPAEVRNGDSDSGIYGVNTDELVKALENAIANRDIENIIVNDFQKLEQKSDFDLFPDMPKAGDNMPAYILQARIEMIDMGGYYVCGFQKI